jgi:hypothetical protein
MDVREFASLGGKARAAVTPRRKRIQQARIAGIMSGIARRKARKKRAKINVDLQASSI